MASGQRIDPCGSLLQSDHLLVLAAISASLHRFSFSSFLRAFAFTLA
jgi:hypothetical protein